MSKPAFKTAIPKRRYKLGEFSIVVLGEVESEDDIDYQYILAVVQGQDPEPGLYITAEKSGNARGRVFDACQHEGWRRSHRKLC